MLTVVETPVFSRRADMLLTEAERRNLITLLASQPRSGRLIPGLAGLRKLRFAPSGRGKSGGFRVIYLLLDDNTPILALLLYGKNEQANPSAEQRRAMVRLVESLKTERAVRLK